MSSATRPVLPHGPVRQLESNLWVVDGTLPRIPIGRRMTLVRTNDGSLFVHNAIVVDDATTREIDALGPVRWVFIPNRFHDMDGGSMSARYSGAKLLAPDTVVPALAKKFPAVLPVSEHAPSDTIRIETIAGLKGGENVMEVRSGDRVTVVYTDALFNLAPIPGFKGFVTKLLGSIGPLKMTRIGRRSLLADAPAFRAHLEAMAARPEIVRVIVSHGDILETDVSGAFARAAAAV